MCIIYLKGEMNFNLLYSMESYDIIVHHVETPSLPPSLAGWLVFVSLVSAAAEGGAGSGEKGSQVWQ